ncbi:MAG: DUF2269 family protein [bacterium]
MSYRYCLVILAGVVLASVPAAVAYAATGMTASTDRVLLLLHHLGMILLFGNIAVSSLWMSRARRTGERSILYYASRTISRADLLFTSDAFYHYERWWSLWNGVVTVLLLASLYLMVFKPHLWGPAA